MSDAYSKPCQTTKIERFMNMVNVFQPLIIFAKHLILYVWEDSDYATDYKQAYCLQQY